jgi:hypothetical protein
MNQPGLFDYSNRLDRIDNVGDPLAELNKAIDWGNLERLSNYPERNHGNPRLEQKATIQS